MGHSLDIIQVCQGVPLSDVVRIVLREGAQVPLAADMFSGTETIASRYVSDYFDQSAEGSTKVAYGAQGATAAIDAERVAE